MSSSLAVKVELLGWRCLKCEHITIRAAGPPRRCGECKSPDWNRPRIQPRRKVKAAAKEKGK